MSVRNFLALSFFFACALIVLFFTRPSREKVKLLNPAPSGVLVQEDSREASFEEVDSYELGYNQGYLAFMSQWGLEPPSSVVEFVYTSSHSVSIVAEDEEMRNRGYADGYHRASESFSCPRGCPH